MSLTCKFVVTLVGSLVRILTFFVYYCWMRNLTSRQNPIFRMRESFILTMLYKLNGPSLPLFLIREKKRIGKYLFRYPACITKMETLINREISQIIQDCFCYLFFLALHNKFAKVSLNSFNNSLCLINTLLTRFNKSKPWLHGKDNKGTSENPSGIFIIDRPSCKSF